MSGLLLTKYFLCYRNYFTYMAVVLIVSLGLFISDFEGARGIIVRLFILISILSPLGIFEKENSSGFDTYAMTLPVKRRTIINSQFLFFVICVVTGLVILTATSVVLSYFNSAYDISTLPLPIMGTLSLAMLSGAISYPLLYQFGYDKSEGIIVGAVFFSMIVPPYIISYGFEFADKHLTSLNLEADSLGMMIYSGLGFGSLLGSYFLTQAFFKKKEY